VLIGQRDTLPPPALLTNARPHPQRPKPHPRPSPCQFRLPPAGTPLPMPKTSSSVLNGVPCVETIATNLGVWAVHLLRQLAAVRSLRLGCGPSTRSSSASGPVPPLHLASQPASCAPSSPACLNHPPQQTHPAHLSQPPIASRTPSTLACWRWA